MCNFYSNYLRLCSLHSKSPSGAALDIGLSKAAVNGWKTGRAKPTDATLQRIADYFGVSVSDLIEEQKEKPSAENGEELEYSDMELLAAYRSADEVTRELIRRALGL